MAAEDPPTDLPDDAVEAPSPDDAVEAPAPDDERAPQPPAPPPPRRKRPKGPARLAREAVRTRRRWLGALAVLAPTIFFIGGDLVRRWDDISRYGPYYRKVYALGFAASLAFWTVLVLAASRRRGFFAAVGATLFFLLFSLVAGVQTAFFGAWNIWYNFDAEIHSQSALRTILGHLPFHRPIVLFHLCVSIAVAFAIGRGARRWVRSGFWTQLVFLALACAGVFGMTRAPASYSARQEGKIPGGPVVKISASPPDLLYFHGVTNGLKEVWGYTNDSMDRRVQLRTPLRVPKLVPRRPTRQPNIVLVVQESQRGDVTCVEYDPACELATPFTNLAAPNRFPLTQLRALDSTTAISISTIWSGLLPVESFEALHRAPLVWEYAKAAGYTTAYWTTQHAMFGNIRLYVQDLPLDHFISSTQIDRQSDPDVGAFDADLADHVIKEWSSLQEPFFVVVHPSNVHYPYVFDERYAPFQPSSFDKTPEKNHEFWNYYKNVVYLSDLAMGRMVDHIRSTESGERTIIIYTSDHGEAFREHWQLGHTSSLFDEETRVPGWIDAPPGTLTSEEEENLRKARREFVYHVDLLPTMLDMMGVWDDPGVTPFRQAMWGHPLTRPERTVAALPMTNCSWVWECAFRNWGMTQGPLKLEAREWDNEYHCFNVLDDPEEQNDLGEAGCGVLPKLARTWFASMPKETPPGRAQTDWGR